MATNNQLNVGLSGSSGSGAFVGSNSPTILTPVIAQINDAAALGMFTFTATASAVNHLNLANNSIGLGPVLTAEGTDTNIKVNINGKGTGGLNAMGTGTNDAATAGYIGEVISNAVLEASGVSLSTGAAKTVCSISLTAGDWDVVGNFYIVSTSASVQQGAISTTDNTLPDNSLVSGPSSGTFSITAAGGSACPPRRQLLSATTTIYLIAQCNFNSGTAKASGSIYARRAR